MISDVPVRMPAEWEFDGPVMLSWPHEATDWAPMLDRVEACYVNLVKVIAPYHKLLIIAPDTDRVKKALAGVSGVEDRVLLCDMPTNDTWARDFGPLTVETSDTVELCDFTFNGWGLKFASDKDNMVNRRLKMLRVFAVPVRNCKRLVLEGGSVESDGKGTLMTTGQCLLSPNRNPGLSRSEIERELRRELGFSRILWITKGFLEGDDTDSHVDTLARFAPHDTIIYVAPPDNPMDPHYAGLKDMRRELKTFVTPHGVPYNLVELPMADPVYDEDGCRLPATYANFLATARAVFMPVYGSPQKDDLAAMTLKSAFPDHDIVAVDCRALIEQHGSLHCATMQLPANSIQFYEDRNHSAE